MHSGKAASPGDGSYMWRSAGTEVVLRIKIKDV